MNGHCIPLLISMNRVKNAHEAPNRFDSIADVFNRIRYFSEEYKNFVIRHIHHDLALASDDTLLILN